MLIFFELVYNEKEFFSFFFCLKIWGEFVNNIISKKNVIWNMLGTTFNAFNSLFFMMIVTRINGLEDSGIFTLAFSLACLFCLIGGYEGRVYQVTDIKNEYSNKEYIVHRIITCFIMMLFVVGYCFFMGYDTYKFFITFLLCLMKCLEVFSDVFYGFLQKEDQLYRVGISLFCKSVFSVLVFIIVDLLTKNLLITCLFVNIVWLLIFLIYDLPKSKKVIDNSKFYWGNIFKLFKTGFFAFSISFLSVYLVNAQKYALDGVVSEDLQAIFGIILMPATIISLAGQYLLQPILNNIANSYSMGDKRNFNLLVIKALLFVFVFGIICIICAYLLGVPVLQLLYSVDISDYKLDLLIIITGAILYAMSTLLSAALTTVRYTFIQFVVFGISSLIALFISRPLIIESSLSGASISYLITMSCQFALYTFIYYFIMKKIDFGKRNSNASN